MEFWVYPTRNGGFEHLVSNAYFSTNYGAIYLLNGRIQYWQANIGSISTAAGSVPLNTWTHVAVTYDGNAGAGNRFATIYLNGVLSATSVDHLETFNNALKFGYAVSGTDSKFKGLLDEISLYNQALSAADILSISNAGMGGKCVASSLSVNDVSVAEGNAGTTTASFAVSAVRHANPVTFDYATADNTATAPSDYLSTSGSVLIPANGTAATINVTVNGDTTFEPDETFFVNLSNVTGVSVLKGQAVGTIINDECFAAPANMFAWWPAENNANEIQGGNNGVLENGVAFAAGEVGQAFSFNGTDSVLTPTLNIGSAFTVELWIYPTSAGGFQHLISNDFNSTSYGALYYHTDHVEYWWSSAVRVSSPAVPLNTWTHVALTYDGSADRLYVNGNLVATSAGTHNENFNNALRFGYSISPQDTHFQGLLDEITLYNRTLSGNEVLSLYSTHNTGKCSIMPNMSINNVTLAEGNAGTTNFTFTVSLSQASGTTVLVDYATANGTATAPGDYQSTSGTLMIPAGSTSGIVTVPVNGDTAFELDETFFVNLTNATNANIVGSQGVGTIINDDCSAPPPNMVSWWPAENNANDIQGGNNGILENGVTFAAGEVGQAFNFNGTNSVLTPTLNIGTAFTVELWIYPTSPGGFQHLVSNDSNSTSYGALYFLVNHVEYWWGGAVRLSSPAVPLNTWTHVALTYDGSAGRLYINGSLVATSAGTHSENFNNALRFGFAITPQDSHFQGSLDEITLYSRALTAPEILSVFSTHSGGKCSGGSGPASWTGASNADWHNPGNWTSGTVPLATDGVVIPGSGVTNEPTISSANVTASTLSIAAGRTLTVSGGRMLVVNGTLTNGGTLTGAGTTNWQGGTMLNSGVVSIANFNFNSAGAQALNGSGSFSSDTATIIAGSALTLQSNHQMATLVIQGGATMDISSRILQLTGSLMNGGTLTVLEARSSPVALRRRL